MALVDGNVLDAHKVFALGDLLLDGPLDLVLLPRRPRSVDAGRAGVGEAKLDDLGPLAAAIVVGNLARRLGDVDESRAGVLNLLVEEELEANRVTSLDGVGARVAGLGSLVAPKVGRVDNVFGVRGLVRVGVLAGVGVFASDSLTFVGHEVEDVVGVDSQGGRQQREERASLHGESERRELEYIQKKRMWKRRDESKVDDCDASPSQADGHLLIPHTVSYCITTHPVRAVSILDGWRCDWRPRLCLHLSPPCQPREALSQSRSASTLPAYYSRSSRVFNEGTNANLRLKPT